MDMPKILKLAEGGIVGPSVPLVVSGIECINLPKFPELQRWSADGR